MSCGKKSRVVSRRQLCRKSGEKRIFEIVEEVMAPRLGKS
jgi:hypothetical protein